MDFTNNISFPIAKRIFSSTIGHNLVPVMPMNDFVSERQKIITENRDRKIKSILENIDYIEYKINDDASYKINGGPSGVLYYLDFKYK